MTLGKKAPYIKRILCPFPVFSYLESLCFEIQRERECREKLEEERDEGR